MESEEGSLVPLIIDCPVHLGLELVGASADGTPVATSPLCTRVLLKVLREEVKERKRQSLEMSVVQQSTAAHISLNQPEITKFTLLSFSVIGKSPSLPYRRW